MCLDTKSIVSINMGVSCAIAECRNSDGDKRRRREQLVFHSFPKDPNVFKAWVTKCKRKDVRCYKKLTVCSDHFREDDYKRDLQAELSNLPSKKRLKPDAIPSVFTFRSIQQNDNFRHERIKRRQQKRKISEVLASFRCVGRAEDKENDDQNADESASWNEILNPCGGVQIDENGRHELNQNSCRNCELKDQNSSTLNEAIMKLQSVIDNQRKEIIRLHSVISSLKSEMRTTQVGLKSKQLQERFSAAQRRLLDGEARVRWSEDDIVRALSLRASGLKAYNNVMQLSNLPLPSVRTLNRWASNFGCDIGILREVLESLQKYTQHMDELSRISVISFDEMSVDSRVTVDPKTSDLVSHSKAQVCMLRGLMSSWKQPVYYEFNTDMTITTLNEVITAVESVGLKVVAVVCDLGAENRSFLKHAGVTVEQTFFKNPVDANRNVYCFADVPHCIKNLRNHVVDEGVVFGFGKYNPEGCKIDIKTMRHLANNNGDGELRRVPYLTHSWLSITDAERMRVKPAVQFFSHRVACLAWECFPQNPVIGNFFEIINDGFDVLNSRRVYDNPNARSAFGINLEEQTEKLELFEDLIRNARFQTGKGNIKRVMLPCQIGIIMSARSLKLLHEDLKRTCDVRYILTSRLNQDCLENFFSRIRAFGGPHSHPNAVEFKYRLKLLLLGSRVKASKGSNVEGQEDVEYLCSNLLRIPSVNVENKLNNDSIIQAEVVNNIETLALGEVQESILTNTSRECLVYLAGYLAWKLNRKLGTDYSQKGANVVGYTNVHDSWIKVLSRGRLTVPNDYIVSAVYDCEVEFEKFYELYSKSKYLSRRLYHHMKYFHPHIDDNIIREFLTVRLRIKASGMNENRKSILRRNFNKKKQFSRSSNKMMEA